jgi:hypothetical protein
LKMYNLYTIEALAHCNVDKRAVKEMLER